ncbi:MAG: DUF134 domain-containing protein [Promethearchaeota archaeon]
MGRRTRLRLVKRTPNNIYFQDFTNLENIITITVAEFEAMRLKHYINLNQKESAERMGISQPTFSRILDSAHQKITQALIEGKAIKVYGGNVNYKIGFVGYGCLNCNHEWEDREASKDRKVDCPECKSKKVYYLEKEPL